MPHHIQDRPPHHTLRDHKTARASETIVCIRKELRTLPAAERAAPDREQAI